jgi:hypothetical protein
VLLDALGNVFCETEIVPGVLIGAVEVKKVQTSGGIFCRAGHGALLHEAGEAPFDGIEARRDLLVKRREAAHDGEVIGKHGDYGSNGNTNSE